MFDNVRSHALLALPLMLLGGSAFARHPSPASLDLTNRRDEPVQVVIDDVVRGFAAPGEALELRLRPGNHDIRILDARGKLIQEQRVSVRADEDRALVVAPDRGRVEVANLGPMDVEVRLSRDGEAVRVLALSGAQRRGLGLRAGTYTVDVVATWFGQEEVIAHRRLVVEPGEKERLAIRAPREALVQVTNPSPVDAQLMMVRGDKPARSLGAVAAGEVALVMVPLGNPRLELWDGSRLLDAQQVGVTALEGGQMLASVPMGELDLDNHRRDTVLVFIDDEPGRSLRPQSELELDLVVGTHTLVVEDMRGRVVLTESVEISADEDWQRALREPSRSRISRRPAPRHHNRPSPRVAHSKH